MLDFITSLRMRRRLLARREQLHGADDVDLLHGHPAAGAQRRGHDVQVDDGVDLGGLQDLHDERVADVGADVLGALQVDLGLVEVDADDVLDVGVAAPARCARRPPR